jgi:DNA-binding response OmpR family regulator
MLHILLVEDNPADVLLIREALRTSAFPADVVIAYDGEQACNVCDVVPFGLILLDLSIPSADGFQLLQQRRLQQGPPVVVFTGSRSPDDRKRALELGASDFVIKPANKHAFVRAVHDILDHWAPAPDAIVGVS